MAKLSAHGTEIGRLYFTTSAKAYFEDGTVLKNSGSGWKVSGKVKAGTTPKEAFDAAKLFQEEFLAKRPALVAYRKALNALAGLGNRWKLDSAISVLGDDYDGIWSEVADGYGDNISASVDEIAEVAKLYELAQKEQAELKGAKV